MWLKLSHTFNQEGCGLLSNSMSLLVTISRLDSLYKLSSVDDISNLAAYLHNGRAYRHDSCIKRFQQLQQETYFFARWVNQAKTTLYLSLTTQTCYRHSIKKCHLNYRLKWKLCLRAPPRTARSALQTCHSQSSTCSK